MLELNNNENFTGTSKIDGVVAERYTATINQQDPSKITINRFIVNQQLRKDNRDQCRADMAEFEDDVYTVQDSMLATDSKVENVDDTTEVNDETDQ